MERAASLAGFEAQPSGRYFVSGTALHFCAHPACFGIILWGRQTREAIDRLIHALRVELRPEVPRHRSLVDASRLEGAEVGAFEALDAYVRDNRARLEHQVERLALVRPGGLSGALVAGFYEVASAPYPVSLFESLADALAWLGEAAELAHTLDAAVAAVTGIDPVVAAVRARLAESPIEAALAEVARVMAVSERTLQRRLQEAGTSFSLELAGARVVAAKQRLLDTDDSITAIAIDVGFASLQHMSAAFRKATGETPSAWRKKRRKP